MNRKAIEALLSCLTRLIVLRDELGPVWREHLDEALECLKPLQEIPDSGDGEFEGALYLRRFGGSLRTIGKKVESMCIRNITQTAFDALEGLAKDLLNLSSQVTFGREDLSGAANRLMVFCHSMPKDDQGKRILLPYKEFAETLGVMGTLLGGAAFQMILHCPQGEATPAP